MSAYNENRNHFFDRLLEKFISNKYLFEKVSFSLINAAGEKEAHKLISEAAVQEESKGLIIKSIKDAIDECGFFYRMILGVPALKTDESPIKHVSAKMGEEFVKLFNVFKSEFFRDSLIDYSPMYPDVRKARVEYSTIEDEELTLDHSVLAEIGKARIEYAQKSGTYNSVYKTIEDFYKLYDPANEYLDYKTDFSNIIIGLITVKEMKLLNKELERLEREGKLDDPKYSEMLNLVRFMTSKTLIACNDENKHLTTSQVIDLFVYQLGSTYLITEGLNLGESMGELVIKERVKIAKETIEFFSEDNLNNCSIEDIFGFLIGKVKESPRAPGVIRKALRIRELNDEVDNKQHKLELGHEAAFHLDSKNKKTLVSTPWFDKRYPILGIVDSYLTLYENLQEHMESISFDSREKRVTVVNDANYIYLRDALSSDTVNRAYKRLRQIMCDEGLMPVEETPYRFEVVEQSDRKSNSMSPAIPAAIAMNMLVSPSVTADIELDDRVIHFDPRMALLQNTEVKEPTKNGAQEINPSLSLRFKENK